MLIVYSVVLHDLTSWVVFVDELLRDWDCIVDCLLPLPRTPAAEKTKFRIILLPLSEIVYTLLLFVLFLFLLRFSISLYFRFFVYVSHLCLRLCLLLLRSV